MNLPSCCNILAFLLLLGCQPQCVMGFGFKITPRPAWIPEFSPALIQEIGTARPVTKVARGEFVHQPEGVITRMDLYQHQRGKSMLESVDLGQVRSFQRIELHEAYLLRNGTVIDLLPTLSVQLKDYKEHIQDELYDHWQRSTASLPKTIPGDLILLTYSRVGKQPGLDGRLDYRIEERIPNGYLDTELPFANLAVQLWIDPQDSFRVKTMNGFPEPKIRYTPEFTRLSALYQPDLSRVAIKQKQKFRLHRPPSWYFTEAKLMVTTFYQWSEIVKSEMGFYSDLDAVSEEILVIVNRLCPNPTPLQPNIDRLIHFVKDSIRYEDYGLLIPKPPEMVLSQRFGDCKSKSNLLILMLKIIGVDAWPVTVKASGFSPLLLDLPTHDSFDHIVVEYRHQGKNHLVDVTESFSSAEIDCSSHFGYGLRLKPRTRSLTRLPAPPGRKITVFDTLKCDSCAWNGGLATLARTISFGSWYQEENRQALQRKSEESLILDWLPYAPDATQKELLWAYTQQTKFKDRKLIGQYPEIPFWEVYRLYPIHEGEFPTHGWFKLRCPSFSELGFLDIEKWKGKTPLKLPPPFVYEHHTFIYDALLTKAIKDTVTLEGPNMQMKSWASQHPEGVAMGIRYYNRLDFVMADQYPAFKRFLRLWNISGGQFQIKFPHLPPNNLPPFQPEIL